MLNWCAVAFLYGALHTLWSRVQVEHLLYIKKTEAETVGIAAAERNPGKWIKAIKFLSV